MYVCVVCRRNWLLLFPSRIPKSKLSPAQGLNLSLLYIDSIIHSLSEGYALGLFYRDVSES